MTERDTGSTQRIIEVLTPDNIPILGQDMRFQGALALLRQGVWELRDMNGVKMTDRHMQRYTPKLNTVDPEENNFEKYWAAQRENNWDPFLMVASNVKDGVVGVLEGREYTAGERAMYVNWIVTKKSHRGLGVASGLYDRLEEIGRSHGVTVLLALINSLNHESNTFHVKKGFVNEKIAGYISSYGSVSAFRTKSGLYIPSFRMGEFDSNGHAIDADMNFYTKRLELAA